MKTLQLFLIAMIGGLLVSSCVAEVIIEEDTFIDQPTISLQELLHGYEIWYVDIERTQGVNDIPFLQKAFTISFRNGNFFANNNLAGMGSNGNGFGLDVGFYDTFGMQLEISHDLDGFYNFEVDQVSGNEIRLYDPVSRSSYYLIGNQRNNFDYEKVFYDNIHYFLQEYEVWEKVYTSQQGVLNEFDNENYLQFLYYGVGDNFNSSQDPNGTPIPDLFFDYTGYYEVRDIPNDFYRKTLTLDYEYLGNEYFELTVINDRKIQVFHPSSGTTYEFAGRRLLQFKNGKQENTSQNETKRLKKADFRKLAKQY